MSDDLDLRALHQRHEPNPEFRAALRQRVAQIVSGDRVALADPDGSDIDHGVVDHGVVDLGVVDLGVVDLDELASGHGSRRMPWPALLVAATAAAVIVITVVSIPPDQSPVSIDPTAVPPVVLASGEDVEFVGEDGLGGQTLDVSAEYLDGVVTGELRFSDPGGEVVVAVECADTATDGVVILGGTVTESTDDEISGLAALFIKEGDPDSVAVWLDEGENESCRDLLLFRHDVLDDEGLFVDVEVGSDIVTG